MAGWMKINGRKVWLHECDMCNRLIKFGEGHKFVDSLRVVGHTHLFLCEDCIRKTIQKAKKKGWIDKLVESWSPKTKKTEAVYNKIKKELKVDKAIETLRKVSNKTKFTITCEECKFSTVISKDKMVLDVYDDGVDIDGSVYIKCQNCGRQQEVKLSDE